MTDQPPLTVRFGSPADYAAVLEIQCRAYREKEAPLYGPAIPPLQETPDTLAKELADGKDLIVGEQAGIVVASLRVQRRADGSIYWGRLSVDPRLQGQGIGQKMAQAVESMFSEANKFVLDCGEKSAENMHIYQKLGYRTTGESFQVPNGPLVVVMEKEAR